MRLDIKHWQMLKAISEAGTVHRAASILGVTQSALSHRLAEAERRLGGRLYEREGRQLRQTAAGRAMTQTAQHIIPLLERAETDFKQLSADAVSVVRFGVAAYSCYHWLADFLELLSREEPSIRLELVACATQKPLQNLQQSVVDVVLAPGYTPVAGIEAIPVFKDELVLVTSVKHKLADKHFIEAHHLSGEEYLTYSKTAQPGFEYERFIRPSGVVPHLVTVVEVSDAIVELIVAGFGVSILSRWAMQSARKNNRINLVQVSEQGLDLPWSALLRQSESPASPARIVAARLEQWFSGYKGY